MGSSAQYRWLRSAEAWVHFYTEFGGHEGTVHYTRAHTTKVTNIRADSVPSFDKLNVIFANFHSSIIRDLLRRCRFSTSRCNACWSPAFLFSKGVCKNLNSEKAKIYKPDGNDSLRKQAPRLHNILTQLTGK